MMTHARQRWPHALLGLLLMLSFLSVPLSQAGTEEDPEIEDPTGDPEYTPLGMTLCLPGELPELGGSCAPLFENVDVIKGWVQEDEDHFIFFIQVAGEIASGPTIPQLDIGTTGYIYQFHATAGDVEITAGAEAHAGGLDPTGDATSTAAEGDTLALFVPRAAAGDPATGSLLTELYIESSVFVFTEMMSLGSDRAPSEGFGRDYEVGSASDDETSLPFEFVMESDNRTATTEAGQNLALPVTARLTDPVNVTTTVDLTLNATAPEGWSFTYTPSDSVSLDNETTNATVSLNVAIPLETEPGQYEVVARALGPDNATASISFTVTVEEPDDEPEPTPPPAPPTAPPTDPGNGNGDGNGDGSTFDDYLDTLSDNWGYVVLSGALLAAVLVLCIIGLAGRWKA